MLQVHGGYLMCRRLLNVALSRFLLDNKQNKKLAKVFLNNLIFIFFFFSCFLHYVKCGNLSSSSLLALLLSQSYNLRRRH